MPISFEEAVSESIMGLSLLHGYERAATRPLVYAILALALAVKDANSVPADSMAHNAPPKLIKDAHPELLAMPVENIELTKRTTSLFHNVMKDQGIFTVEQLVRESRDHFLSFKRVGRIMVGDVEAWLTLRGLSFGMV